jgi:hypothetical protein
MEIVLLATTTVEGSERIGGRPIQNSEFRSQKLLCIHGSAELQVRSDYHGRRFARSFCLSAVSEF